jgi:hypothetical protein
MWFEQLHKLLQRLRRRQSDGNWTATCTMKRNSIWRCAQRKIAKQESRVMTPASQLYASAET